jgi:hypothetical protein
MSLDEEPTGIASNGADEIIVTFAHKLEVRRYRIGSEKLIVPFEMSTAYTHLAS